MPPAPAPTSKSRRCPRRRRAGRGALPSAAGRAGQRPVAATAGHPGIADSQRLAEESLALGQWRGYQAKLEALNATLRQRQAEHATTRQQVSKLQAAARIAEAREHDYQDLLAKNFISRHAYLDKQQARIEQAGDLASQQSRLQELDAAIAGQAQERQALQANFRSDALDKLREAREQMRQYGEDQKTGQRQALTRLTAPVAGSVQQLAIHTVGGVVTEAQPLLAVVPRDETLEIEAQIENKDIGFVRPGQAATVKVESFPTPATATWTAWWIASATTQCKTKRRAWCSWRGSGSSKTT